MADRAEVLGELQRTRTGTPYLPITRQKTIIFPGTDGGAQWGGAAVDAAGIMYVPAKEVPVYTSLADAPVSSALTSGEKLYQANCSACHGADRKGDHSGAYPSLLGIADRMKESVIHQLLSKGRGMMPAFTHLSGTERKSIVDNYGGPLVTASGLVFIAATLDQKFRVFDASDGRIRWETKLPAAGYATPSTYSVKGRQYVVMACGGGKLRSKSGGYYVALKE